MSRVQLNLLPDVKLQYKKLEKTRKTVLSFCILITGIAVGIFIVLLFSVYVVQKKQLSDASNDITQTTKDIQAIPNISKILTVQNQLQSLVGLHQDKHLSSRIFAYLPQLTPQKVSITSLTLDTANKTIKLSGEADTQRTANKFIDTLKFTTFTVGNNDQAKSAFTSVVESGFSLESDKSTFELTITYDGDLFSNNLFDNDGNRQVPKLHVPKLITTRSVLNNPATGLFKEEDKQ